MNIKKATSNRPLLTIDDPTIYQQASDVYKEFVDVTIGTDVSEIGSDSDTLYLIGADSSHWEPYVWCMDGTYRKMTNPFSRGPTLPYPNAKNTYQLNDNLVAIDNHLYALRKELSYWNLYKISYSVDRADDFSATLASIAPGEALIINIDGEFKYEGQNYSRGDLILRLTDGTYTTVKASTSGFYYPSKVNRDGNKYTLYYSYYQENEPIKNTDPELIPEEGLKDPYQVEYFELEVASAADSFMYGERVDMSATDTYVFQAEPNPHNNNQPIPPIVKFFTIDGEEIAIDFTCSYAASNTQNFYTLDIASTGTGLSKPASLKYAYIK